MPPLAGDCPDMSGPKPNLSPFLARKRDRGMVEIVLNHSPCPELVEGG